MGAERVLGPIPAVAMHVPHVRRGLVPRAGIGPTRGGDGDATAKAGRRPAPRVRPAADEAAARVGAAATGPEAVIVIVADFTVFQLPFFLRGEAARIQRRLCGRGRRLRGRHGALTSGLGEAEDGPPEPFRFLRRAAARSAPRLRCPSGPAAAHAGSRETTPRTSRAGGEGKCVTCSKRWGGGRGSANTRT